VPPRSDWPDRAAWRAWPSSTAVARLFPSNRRELSRDRRTVGSRNHLRLIAIALSPASVRNGDVGLSRPRPDLCAATTVARRVLNDRARVRSSSHALMQIGDSPNRAAVDQSQLASVGRANRVEPRFGEALTGCRPDRAAASC